MIWSQGRKVVITISTPRAVTAPENHITRFSSLPDMLLVRVCGTRAACAAPYDGPNASAGMPNRAGWPKASPGLEYDPGCPGAITPCWNASPGAKC